MKKIIIIITTIIVILTSCTKADDNDPASSYKKTVDYLSYAGLFKTKYITLPDDYRINFNNVFIKNDVLYVLCRKATESLLYTYNLTDLTEKHTIAEPIINGAYIDFMSYASDMSYVTVETLEYETSLNIKNPDGEVIQKDIYSILKSGTFVIKMTVIDDVIYIANEKSLAAVGLDGKVIYTTLFDQKLETFEVSDTGDVFVKLLHEAMWINNFKYIDQFGNIQNNLELTSDIRSYENIDMVYGGEYDLYKKDAIGLYGYNKQDTEPTLVVNWLNSDINIDGVEKIIPLSNDKIITLARDYSYGDGRSIIAISERIPEDEIKEKKIITLYTFDIVTVDRFLNTCILNFNRMSSEYRIVTRSFNTEQDIGEAINNFNNAIASGDIPDIVKINTFMPMDSYINKGLFEDLYEYIDNDNELSREDFIQGTMLPFERDGKLYDICLNFYFSALTGKTSVVGESNKWSFADVLEIYESLPDDGLLTSNFSNDLLAYYLSLYGIDDFVDKDNVSCNFDSENFIEILNIIKKMPDADYDNIMYYEEEIELMQNDNLMLTDMVLSTIETYYLWMAQLDDDITIKGYPTPNGDKHTVFTYTNRCAITSQSEVKEGAWEFLKYVFTDDVQSKINVNIPVTVSGLRKQFDILSSQYFLIRSDGSLIGSDISFTDEERIEYGGVGIEFTDDKYEHFLGLLNSIEKVSGVSDNTIRGIVNEEVYNMINGLQSPESAADNIQNRVSIYLSEQFG